MTEVMISGRPAGSRVSRGSRGPSGKGVARRSARYELSEPLRAFLCAKYLAVQSSGALVGCAERTVATDRAIDPNGSARAIGAMRRYAVSALKLLVLALTVALFAMFAFVGDARADSVVLAHAGGVFGTSQTDQWSFTAPGAGKLDVTLTDFAWPTTTLPSLTVDIMSGSSLLQSLQIQGAQSTTQYESATVSLAAGGTYYAYLLGNAGGPMDFGAYALVASFLPQVAPVPLPASLTLLLGGVVTTTWSLRRRRAASEPAIRKESVTVPA